MMAFKRSTLLVVPFSLLLTFYNVDCQELMRFPEGFLFGVSTAAYQIEGAWNESDKGVNIWDHFTHQVPSPIRDGSSGDIAADSYHKWMEDVYLLKDLGVHTYRLSLSWSRILPTGYSNVVSRDGINYYKTLLQVLRANNIEPVVTLYHWDHPQIIEEMGGWTNRLTVNFFLDYARVVFRELGPLVKYFITINEPKVICIEGYENGVKAPGKILGEIGKYLCMHNIIKAHAQTYHMYHHEFRTEQKGLISIALPCNGVFPKTPADKDEADVAFQFSCGWTAHPIFSKTGDYPEVMKQRIAENSKLEGYPRSKLPEFSPADIAYIRGTADFFCLNHYTSLRVERVPRNEGELWYSDLGFKTDSDPSWPSTVAPWLKVVPQGFRQILNKIRTEYGNPVVFVTENGFADSGQLNDKGRIDYLYDYLSEMLKAMKDGCNVQSYHVWSLLDNFEWEKGYTNLFGLVKVDFNNPNRTRIPKLSMLWYKNLIETKVLMN